MRRRRIPRDCAAGLMCSLCALRCVSVAGEPCHWHVRAFERLEACVIWPGPPLGNLPCRATLGERQALPSVCMCQRHWWTAQANCTGRTVGDTGQCRGIVFDTPLESGVRGLIWIIAGMFLLLSPYVMTVQQHTHRRGDGCGDLVYHDAHMSWWHLPTAIVLAITGRGGPRPVHVGAPARRRAEQSQRGTNGRE